MKRQFLPIAFLFCSILNVYSQSKIYVIFTSTESEVKGVWKEQGEGYTNEQVRDTPYFFALFDRGGGNYTQSYFFDFIYKNEQQSPNSPILIKSKTFLDTITMIDWDKVTSKDEAETKYQHILSHDEIYFIDRSEFTSNSIRLYPVKRLKLNQY